MALTSCVWKVLTSSTRSLGTFFDKDQWVVLPADQIKDLSGIYILPPGLVPQHNHRDQVIIGYTWSVENHETLYLPDLEAIQFGHTLDRILQAIILANRSI